MIDVGLIGFGLGGRCFHAPVIRAVEGLRLAAILQRTGDTAAQLYPDARMLRTLDELLAIDSIQLIAISTPNQTHYPLAKFCLEAGRHVVVDKPFTTTVTEATELLPICPSNKTASSPSTTIAASTPISRLSAKPSPQTLSAALSVS